MRTVSIYRVWSACLLLAGFPLVAGAGADLNAGSQPAFVLGSAYAQAVRQEATGVFVLGTTRIRNWTATHYLLVRYGRGLQIQTKANGAWLPRLEGSSGGHSIGAERFDELLSLAGGVNRDVRQLPVAQRDRFFCVAGFGGCVGKAGAATEPDADHETLATRGLRPGSVGNFLAGLLGAPAFAGAICAQCQPYFANTEAGNEFRFEFDRQARALWLQGWGIRAGWRVPPLDEI